MKRFKKIISQICLIALLGTSFIFLPNTQTIEAHAATWYSCGTATRPTEQKKEIAYYYYESGYATPAEGSCSIMSDVFYGAATVGTYYYGETVKYDRVYPVELYSKGVYQSTTYFISWIGASGKRRFMKASIRLANGQGARFLNCW